MPVKKKARSFTPSGILPLSVLRNIASYIGQLLATPYPVNSISATMLMLYLKIPTRIAHRLSNAAVLSMTKNGESTPKSKVPSSYLLKSQGLVKPPFFSNMVPIYM